MRMPQARWKVFMAAGLVVVSIGGTWYYVRTSSAGGTPNYLTADAVRGRVASTIAATGFVEPQSQVTLTFKNAGLVSTVAVQTGQAVIAGSLLATQEAADLEAQVAQAAANLRVAEARLDSLLVGARNEDLAVSRATVESAKVALENARLSLANAEAKAQVDLSNSKSSLASVQQSAATNRSTYDADLRELSAAEQAYQTALDHQEELQERYNQAKAEQVQTQQSLAGAQQAYSEAASTYGARSPHGVAAAETAANLQAVLDKVNLALTDLQFQLDTAKTNTSQLQSDYNYLLNLVNQGKSKVESDASLLEKERASAALAPLITAQAVDSAKNQVAQAEANLATAEANYAKLLAGAADPDIRAAQAAMDQASAVLQVATNNLASAQIIAPFDGIVASVSLTPGQFVPSGSSGGGILLISQALQVKAQINEADIAKAQPGQQTTFTANAYPGRVFTGTVLAVSPIATTVSSVQLFDVTLSIDNPPPTMKAGLPLSVQVVTAERLDVITVPRTAVSYAQALSATTQLTPTPSLPATPPGETTGAAPTGTPGSGKGSGGGSGVPGSGSGTGIPGSGTGTPGSGAGTVQNKAPSIIMVQETNGKIVPVTVQLGLSDAKSYEVISGLTEGATVITGIKPEPITSKSSSPSLIPVSTPGSQGGR